jgi:glutathione synthase/RimK-type ligase-like ATP-grasp enzyme
MKIAIHNSSRGFHPRWIKACEDRGIPYKLVDSYKNDIIDQVRDCDAFMWHFNNSGVKDVLFAKQLLFSLQQAGKIVFPDFNTGWHFDDKVGQKYLLESLNIPMVPSYVFYDQKEALAWVNNTDFPKVFKLRGGAGSANVKLIESRKKAIKVVKQAFGKGFSQYDAWGSLKERYRKYKIGKAGVKEIFKGVARLIDPPRYAKVMGRDVGYVYFQDFIPNNDFDIRVVIVDDKAFAIKRMVREDDFRASGSGSLLYEKEHFSKEVIERSFHINEKIRSQSLAIDFVFNNENEALVVEISYGYSKEGYDACEGYWDKNLNFYQGPFDFCGWMVDAIAKWVNSKR